jgi:hypothetical protein
MDKYFQLILKDIDERRLYIAKALYEGAAKDYSEYRGMCGEIRGLSLAYETVEALLRKLEKDDDE